MLVKDFILRYGIFFTTMIRYQQFPFSAKYVRGKRGSPPPPLNNFTLQKPQPTKGLKLYCNLSA